MLDKVTEARRKLGLQSNPKLYMKEFQENTPTKTVDKNGKEHASYTVSFAADAEDIKNNNLTKEQIINKYANGQEGLEGMNIIKHVKENETDKAIELTKKYASMEEAKAPKTQEQTINKDIAIANKEAQNVKQNTQENTQTKQTSHKNTQNMDMER